MKRLTDIEKRELHKLIIWFNQQEKAERRYQITCYMWRKVIWNAIEGKYDNISEYDVQRVMENDYNFGEDDDDMYRKDILNQLSVLRKIEYEWRYMPIERSTLMCIYSNAYGIRNEDVRFRINQLQLESGYKTQILPEQINCELEQFFVRLVEANQLCSSIELEIKFNRAAELFTKLIYIHPFPDGNGRTARLLVNLLMRRWNLPYIPIPKVRNSPQWLFALQDTLEGKQSEISLFYQNWMIENLREIKNEFSD